MAIHQTITDIKYIQQRLQLDTFEDAALKELQLSYQRAQKIAANKIASLSKKALSTDAPTRLHQEAAIARLRALYAETDDVIQAIVDKLTPQVAEAAAEAGVYSYRDTNDILSWGAKVPAYENVSLSARQLKSLFIDEPYGGKTLDEWLFSAFKGEHKEIYDEVISDIRAGRLTGQGYKGILSNITNRYQNYFDNSKVKQDIETVTKSYIQAANAKSHKDIYDANKDVISGVEWSAVMENGNTKTGRGTCPRCMALDGQEYASIEEGPDCPLHPRCRCMYIPVTKSWKELGIDDTGIDEIRKEIDDEWGAAGTRVSERNLQTRAREELLGEGFSGKYGTFDQGYDQYWEKQPEGWQNNAVGPVRAELIREGHISFQDIVNKDGDLIPIKELTLKGGLKATTGGTVIPPTKTLSQYNIKYESNGLDPLIRDASTEVANRISTYTPETLKTVNKIKGDKVPGLGMAFDNFDYDINIDNRTYATANGISEFSEPGIATDGLPFAVDRGRIDVTIAHEFGHATQRTVFNQLNDLGGEPGDYFQQSLKEIFDTADKPSNYAKKNYREMFAEAFAERYAGDIKSDSSKKVMLLLDDLVKKYGVKL